MFGVYGYAYLTTPASPAAVSRWRARIEAHCAAEGLDLDLVFVDNGATNGNRPGWTALLDALSLHDAPSETPMVVLPSLAHLSSDLAIFARMRAQLDHVGATTTVMPRTPPHRRPRTRTGPLPPAPRDAA